MTRILIVAAFAATSSLAIAQPVAVTLSEFKVVLARDTVRAGSVTFKVKNSGTMTHGFYVRGDGVDKGSRDIEAGQEASLTVTLKPGTYEVFCPMADLTHKAAGMVRKVIVTPGDTPAPKKPASQEMGTQ
ncbi:MAG: cupredoxin domain-containing protein [Gemmatimonadales bacterium]